MARAPDLPLSRSGGRTQGRTLSVESGKVVGRRALRSSFKSMRDSSMNYTLARCLSSGVQLGLFPTRPRKRCERVCDRAFFHTQGARAPRSKNRRPLDAKGTPLVAGHVVSVNSIRQHSQSFDSALDTLVSRHGARRVDQIGCDTPCRQPTPLTCFFKQASMSRSSTSSGNFILYLFSHSSSKTNRWVVTLNNM